MKTTTLTPFLIFGLLIGYDFLFWNQPFGINLPLFMLLLTASFFYLFPLIKSSKSSSILLITTLLACLLVAVNNTYLAKWTAIILLLVSVSFVHHISFRSAPYGLIYFGMQLIRSPLVLWTAFRKLTGHSPRAERIFRYHKLVHFPALITIIFFIIYSIGDPQFANSLDNVVKYLSDFLEWLSKFFSFSHLFFLLFGLLLIIASTLPKSPSAILERELKESDLLRRKRKERFSRKPNALPSVYTPGTFNILSRPVLALKNEYHRGVITLVLINLLLLCVNAVDVSKVWFEGQHDVLQITNWRSNAAMRSEAVHSSTDALIFSIFLAMAVLLFFFKEGNLNFLRKNKLIRQLAYVWIVQNVLLGVTVALRNCYYIDDCGLTMKRIGVFAFLLATFIGLLTFYFKISEKKSTFYLVRINSWAVAGIFLLLSLVDWDPMMASYNINHLPADKLDKQFLLWMSDHALPVLIEHKEIFLNNPDSKKMPWQKEDQLTRKVEYFIDDYEHRSWPSWNYANYRVYHYLLTQQKVKWNRSLESSTN